VRSLDELPFRLQRREASKFFKPNNLFGGPRLWWVAQTSHLCHLTLQSSRGSGGKQRRGAPRPPARSSLARIPQGQPPLLPQFDAPKAAEPASRSTPKALRPFARCATRAGCFHAGGEGGQGQTVATSTKAFVKPCSLLRAWDDAHTAASRCAVAVHVGRKKPRRSGVHRRRRMPLAAFPAALRH
jgi:hypothetical protein